jgi:hypothetical protein
MSSYKDLAVFYNNIFDTSKDVVMTLDYTAYGDLNTTPDGGIVFGFLPYYRVAPDGTSAGAGLGYSDDITLSASGIFDAQFGVALDFSGYFSTSGTGTVGFSAIAPNTISIRGPAVNQYPLLVTTPNLTSIADPFLLYSSITAVESKRVRVRLSDFGSRILVSTKSSNDVDFINRIDHLDSNYQTTSYVRLYWAFCASNSATHISIQNLNINGYDTTLSYTYSGAYYLGLSANPATLTETQLLSVVNVYPNSLNRSFSGIGPLILINNANSGAPYVADNISTSQRYSMYYTPSASDSFIFVTYQ